MFGQTIIGSESNNLLNKTTSFSVKYTNFRERGCFCMKIGFVAHGPASGNALKPLIAEFRKLNEVYLYPFHPYVEDLWQEEIKDIEKGLTLCQKDLDVIFYGTGSGHLVETSVPQFGRVHGVITVSILDTFCDTQESMKKRFPETPDYIICPNQKVKEVVLSSILIDSKNVLVLGNPHLDRLNVLKKTIKDVEQVSIPYRVAFISEPSDSSSFSSTSDRAKLLFEKLLLLYNNSELVQELIFCPHPRESHGFIDEISPESKSLQSSFDVAIQSDIVIGFESIILYEMVYLGKRTIFANDLTSLNALFTVGLNISRSVDIVSNATENIVAWLKSLD